MKHTFNLEDVEAVGRDFYDVMARHKLVLSQGVCCLLFAAVTLYDYFYEDMDLARMLWDEHFALAGEHSTPETAMTAKDVMDTITGKLVPAAAFFFTLCNGQDAN